MARRGEGVANARARAQTVPLGTRDCRLGLAGEQGFAQRPLSHLLLEVANLVEDIALDQVALRVVAVGGIGTHRLRDRHRARGVGEVGGEAPGHDAVLTDEVELRATDGHVACVALDHDRVAVHAAKGAAVDRHAFGALYADRAAPRKRPVAAAVGRQSVGLQV